MGLRGGVMAVLLATAGVTASCGGRSEAGQGPEPPPVPREFRAVWVATVDNIDWPTKPGLPTGQQQAEARAILDRCVDGKKMCASQMMAIDAAGGAGKGGLASTMRSPWRDFEGTERERIVVAALCTPTNPLGLPIETAAVTGVALKN